MHREAARWRASPNLSWWLCTPGGLTSFHHSAGRCSLSCRMCCAPSLTFRWIPFRGAFIHKSVGIPAWEAGATRLSLFEEGSRQSLTSSWTWVSLAPGISPHAQGFGGSSSLIHRGARTWGGASSVSRKAQRRGLPRVEGENTRALRWAQLHAAGKHMFIQTLSQGGLSPHPASACPQLPPSVPPPALLPPTFRRGSLEAENH